MRVKWRGDNCPSYRTWTRFSQQTVIGTFINSINKGNTLFANTINNKYKQATNWWHESVLRFVSKL